MSSESNSSSSGLSTLGLLGIVFVTLKLLKVIDWSWWYVTMPFWIGLPLVLIGLIIFFAIQLYKKKQSDKRHAAWRKKMGMDESKD